MFVVATEILDRYVGDFRLFIKNEILEPLLMSSTTFSEKEAKKSGHLSHSWDGFSDRVVPYWFSEPDANFIHGAGGMVSNVNDMVCCRLPLLNPKVQVEFPLDEVA
jgi:CubicO group peptidase (beta-lactamase class C family)